MASAAREKPAVLRDLFESSSAVKVDKEAGIIRGVKVLGHKSANGREYSRSAVTKAKGFYEGRSVNVDHPLKAGQPRGVADRLGNLTGIREEADGLYGDLHYLKSHPLAGMIVEAAERMPDQLGLSHNAEGRVVTKNGKQLVEEIIRVRSVDLVSDPATVKGLFEQEGYMEPEAPITTETPASGGSAIAAAYNEEIMKVLDSEGDLQVRFARIKELMKSKDDAMKKLSGEPAAKKETPAASESTDEGQEDEETPGMAQLQEKIVKLELREEVRDLFESAGFKPDKLQLEATILLPTVEKRKAFVESLAKPQQRRPRSAGPMTTLTESRDDPGPPKNAKEFAALVKR